MKLNIILLTISLAILGIVCFRMGALTINRKFFIDQLPLVLALITLVVIVWRIEGRASAQQGVVKAVGMTFSFMPMLVIMFLVMGQAMVLADAYKPELTTYLSGNKGFWGSLVSAFLMPGSLTSLPIITELWKSGVNKGPLLVFLLTSPLVGWQIFLIRQPILGWKLSLIVFSLGTLISFCLTIIIWVLSRII